MVKKYKCFIDELDTNELVDLNNKIKHSGKLQKAPWIYYFVLRFHKLASRHDLSRSLISEKCSELDTIPKLVNETTPIPESTLSEITNYKSKNFHAPNVSNLITLSEFFNVSIDYLVGKTDCEHPEFEKINQATGLSDSAIAALKLKKKISDIPPYSIFPDGTLPFDESNNLDVEAFPNVNRYCLLNHYYHGKKSINDDQIISIVNGIIKGSPEIIDSQFIIDKSTDSPEIIKDKLKAFREHCPSTHFIETLNTLVTYKDGLLVNLISQYLFCNDSPTDDLDKIVSLDNPFIAPRRHSVSDSQEALLLLEIQAELTRIHDNRKAIK